MQELSNALIFLGLCGVIFVSANFPPPSGPLPSKDDDLLWISRLI